MVAIKKHRVLFVLLILILWEVISKSGMYNQALVPTLNSILSSFVSEMLNGNLAYAVLNSFIVILKALFISILSSLVLTSLSKLNYICDDIIDFVISIVHPIPSVAILPLVILWFGIGDSAITFVVIHSMLWPMLLNIKSRVRELDYSYSKISKAFNFSRMYELVHIYLLGSIPALISGSKIAWSRGWRAFISAEMIFGVVGSKSGLGWYLFEQRVYMNSPSLYAGLIAIVISGVIVENVIFVKLENKSLTRWSR